MSSEKRTKRNIKPFNGDNYLVWKYRLRAIVEQEGALTVLDEEPPEILTDEWKNWERFAKGQIIEHIEDSMLGEIPEGATASQIIEKFDSTYACKNLATQLNVQDKLFNYKLRSEMPLKKHFIELDEMIRDLIACGNSVNEMTKVWYLLNTLPHSYDGVVTAIKTMSDDRLTLAFVKKLLLEHDQKLKKDITETSTKALQFQSVNNKYSNKRKPVNKGGNYSRKPYSKPTFKTGQKCYFCGRRNHMKKDCYYYKQELKRQDYRQPNRQGPSRRFESTPGIMTVALPSKEKEDGFAFMMYAEDRTEQVGGNLKFVLDSGATEHLVNDLIFYKDYKQLKVPIKIAVAKKEVCISATHVGNIEVLTNLGHVGVLRGVLYAQEVPFNLLSVRRLQEAGFSVIFNHNGEVIAKIGQKTILTGKRMNELYTLHFIVQNALLNGQAAIIRLDNKDKLWHERLGHISKNKFNQMKIKLLAEDSNCLKEINPLDSLCESCINGKQTRLPFAKIKNKSHIQRPLFNVHSDVCGPITPSTIDGKNYFVNFIDEYTHYTVTYLMTHKSEVITYFKDYVEKSESHFSLKVVHLYCDNGGEYLSADMKEFCHQKGITYHLTVPYTPQQNSVAERMNRTLTEKARAMVHSAGLNKRFWGEAVLTATYLVNVIPSKAIKVEKTPYELWHNKKPKLKYLRVFGCTAYVHNKTRKHKFDDKSIKGILVGYVPNGYKIYIANTRKFIVARDIIFDELKFETSRKELDDTIEIDRYLGDNTDDLVPNISTEEFSVTGGAGEKSVKEIHPGKTDKIINKYNQTLKNKQGVTDECIPINTSTLESEGQGQTSPARDVPEPDDENLSYPSSSKVRKRDKIQDVKRSERLKTKPSISYKDRDLEINSYNILNIQVLDEVIPTCYQEIAKNQNRVKWEKAVEEELNSLIQNKTWALVQKPKNVNIVDSKWVFTIKHDKNGNLTKYKARLVARGFNQLYKLDYDETFAPVARISTLRCLLAFANQYKLLIHQMDVKTAFLNGDLKEDIFMKVPDGIDIKNVNIVCKLNKSLYGLKQSARCWNECFDKTLKQHGFINSSVDRCLYLQNNGHINKNIYVILYVDDVVIVTRETDTMYAFKDFLMNKFQMVDLKEINFFLGIRIQRSECEISLDQTTYLKSVLRKYNMSECNAVSTPLPPKLNYDALESDVDCGAPCRNLIGCLLYAMLCTRPDLCISLNILSKYQSKSNKELWQSLKRVLRYIKGTIEIKLIYKRCDFVEKLIGYVDADWATDETDRRSTTGYVFKMFDNCTVTWNTKRQSSVAASSTEAEYMALFEAVKEALWLKSLLKGIQIQILHPIILFEDNQSCIAIATNPTNHKRSKHIDIKYHFTREQVENKMICLKYVSTGNQEADLFTKSLPAPRFKELRCKLGLLDEKQ